MKFLDAGAPAAFRLNNPGEAVPEFSSSQFTVFVKAHDSHPSIDHLVLLVFEAVMQVVCVSLPGYIIARLGHFDAEKQKFLANLNVMLFTPCLIFIKLASQLNANKLVELAIIPVIFIFQTIVSYLVSIGVSRLFRFNKRSANFVTAMGVFGNSNSLPISLVLSLSQTIQGLHWDKVPGDNDDEVGARGILYLMIFQQLGQLVRWSWGYHVLLAPKDKYDDYREESIEEGRVDEQAPLLDSRFDGHDSDEDRERSPVISDTEVFEPAGRTPIAGASRASPADSEDEGYDAPKKGKTGSAPEPEFRTLEDVGPDGILSFPRIRNNDEPEAATGIKGCGTRTKVYVKQAKDSVVSSVCHFGKRTFEGLPRPMQQLLAGFGTLCSRIYGFLWDFMNPPLWAMLIAVVVASIPDLQRLFFQEGSFVKNSVTNAVNSSAGVAVPLILVVLGANLARNTQKRESQADPEEKEIGTRLLVASLICRMLLPTIIMAPILAVMAKYVPISILDDPIFVIVCFLLTGAPSALQLAQICQINGVYEGVMSKILFQSYVIWILPSTLILVMLALEVVEWAR